VLSSGACWNKQQQRAVMNRRSDLSVCLPRDTAQIIERRQKSDGQLGSPDRMRLWVIEI